MTQVERNQGVMLKELTALSDFFLPVSESNVKRKLKEDLEMHWFCI